MPARAKTQPPSRSTTQASHIEIRRREVTDEGNIPRKKPEWRGVIRPDHISAPAGMNRGGSDAGLSSTTRRALRTHERKAGFS